jgi:predicted TIM-barrel fold metal-dependent hydrolase
MTAISRTEANRLGLDYRSVPPRAVDGPIIDAHSHIYDGPQAGVFFEAAAAYGITHVLSMSPLADAARLAERFGSRISFIAIPDWHRYDRSREFADTWIADLGTFRERHAARLCKFWMAPPARADHGMTLDHETIRTVVWQAFEMGYDFLVHVGDPSVWWRPGARYADTAKFGSKQDQYPQLDWLCENVAPRTVIAAHMGGSIEEPAFLATLLERHANLMLDSSATKWIVREVSRRPAEVREFVLRFADRILFGSDLVASPRYDSFDHYASRYWAHLHLWETRYDGESPIEDPDADDPPALRGLGLPADVLQRMYRTNAERLELAPPRM